MTKNEISIKTGIIDYSEPINGGVPINISISIYEFSFEAIYWIHPNGNSLLECEPNFLKLWGVDDTNKIPFYDELVMDIECILPDKNEIFDEIIKKGE